MSVPSVRQNDPCTVLLNSISAIPGTALIVLYDTDRVCYNLFMINLGSGELNGF